MRAVDPSGLGWSKGEELAAVGQQLGVDGVVVGLLKLKHALQGGGYYIVGPRLWIFSSITAKPVFEAEVNLPWYVDRNWCALDELAARLRVRVLQELASARP